MIAPVPLDPFSPSHASPQAQAVRAICQALDHGELRLSLSRLPGQAMRSVCCCLVLPRQDGPDALLATCFKLVSDVEWQAGGTRVLERALTTTLVHLGEALGVGGFRREISTILRRLRDDPYGDGDGGGAGAST